MVFTALSVSFILENLVLSIGPIGFLVAASYGYKSWLKYEFTASPLLGIVLILKPDLVFPFLLNSQFTNYHWYLANLQGLNLIFSPLYAYIFVNSKDESIFFGHFLSRFVSHVLIVIDNIFVYSLSEHWTFRLLSVSTITCLVEVIFNAIYIFTAKQPKRVDSTEHETIDYIARFDALVLFISGIFMFAFPDLFMSDLKSSDESYRSICRTSGAFVLSMAFESFCATDFKCANDKKKLMLLRITGALLELVLTLVAYLLLNAISFNTFISVSFFNLIYSSILSLGYFSDKPKHNSKLE